MAKKKPFVVAHFKKEKVIKDNFKGIQYIRTEDASGDLYILKEKSPSSPIQFWNRQSNRKISSIKEISRIQTEHSVDDFLGRVEMDYAAPLYYEVMDQIPKELLNKVIAFEVLVNDRLRNKGMDTITTVLYERA